MNRILFSISKTVVRQSSYLLVLLCLLATSVEAGDGVSKLSVRTDRQGQIDDDAFQAKTGWQVVRRLSVSIDLKTDKGFKAVSPKRIFHSGEQFCLRITSSADLYLYVLVYNADKTYDLLFPQSPDDGPFTAADSIRRVPDAYEPLEFSDKVGTEKLRILASPKPLPKISPRQLFDLAAGEKLTADEEALLKRMKDEMNKTAKGLFDQSQKVTRVKNLPTSVQKIRNGGLKKAIHVVAVEESNVAQVVTTASPEASADGVLVVELSLKHEK